MKTLFVSTDFSAAGNNAVKFAIRYAAATGTHLVVFHAAYLPHFDPTISKADLLQLKKDTTETGRKNLDQALTKIFGDLGKKRSEEKVTLLVKHAPFAADAIMETGKELKADLHIIGTHGATGLKILGSITCELIFKAETPVLAIPPHCEYKKIETMVYATDLKNTVSELRCIVPLARPLNAMIEVLNLDFGTSVKKPLKLESLTKDLKYEKMKIVIQKGIKGKSILEQIKNYIGSRKPEILVMFPEERSVLDKIFVRSKTEELAYHAELPLLTFLKSKVGK